MAKKEKVELTQEELAEIECIKIQNKLTNQAKYKISQALFDLQSIIKYNYNLVLSNKEPVGRCKKNEAHIYWKGHILFVRYVGCNASIDFDMLNATQRDAIIKIKKRTWAKYFFREDSKKCTTALLDSADVDEDAARVVDAATECVSPDIFKLGEEIF